MDFKTDTWPIRKLIDLHEAGHLNLSPPYQRNPIWTLKAQQKLMESILAGKPIPNFFLRKTGRSSYEMIDGQQRARTIIGYWKNLITDHENLTYEKRIAQSPNRRQVEARFLDYNLTITIVTKIHDNESIEEYYALLNSSGLRLNRPELKKAEYFSTNFLKLVLECTEDEILQSLRLFTDASTARMNDVDFVSELIALMRFGISDKKEKVDQLYEDDITLEELKSLKKAFGLQMEIFNKLNHVSPMVRTRYKQKSDFYSLFYFYWTVRDVQVATLEHFYRILVKIGPHIRPSQTNCEPFREYAHHCVTQSNSKLARQARHEILVGLFLNKQPKPTAVQDAVLEYFQLESIDLVSTDGFWTLDPSRLKDPHNYEFDFDNS
jgi:Protein of unknown function DUF262